MATASGLEVRVIVIDANELRTIIREEIGRCVAPGAYRPPYIPETVPWWQNPVIACGTLTADSTESTTING